MQKAILIGSTGSLKSLCITAGLYYALKDCGFEIAGMAGASGGSIALPILSKNVSKSDFIKAIISINGDKIQDNDIPQQIIDWLRNKVGLPRKVDPPFTGLLRGNGLRMEISKLYKRFDCETFEKADIPFVVVATKIAVDRSLNSFILDNPNTAFFASLTSKIEAVFERGSVLAPIRASTAIPLVFRPEVINNELYVDGGCVNAIPVLPAINRFGYEDVFIADATTDIIEDPMMTNDIGSIIDVGVATIHAMLRSNTLEKLKLAEQALSSHTKRMIRIKAPVKIKMTETKKAEEQINKAYEYSIKKIKENFDVGK